MSIKLGAIATAIAFFILTSGAHALVFNANVTPNVIYGTGGNLNGGFTIDRQGDIELGLRTHVRYSIPGDTPTNDFNSNGDGSYNHAVGAPVSNPTRARWNFDFSINSYYNGTGGNMLSTYLYQLGIDTDPGLGTVYQLVNPLAFYFDNSYGTNATGSNAGVEPSNPSEFLSFPTLYNVAQNSRNMAFDVAGFDPNVNGRYDFVLSAFSATDTGLLSPLARTSIAVIVGNGASAVPEPGMGEMLLLGTIGLFAKAKRNQLQKQKQV